MAWHRSGRIKVRFAGYDKMVASIGRDLYVFLIQVLQAWMLDPLSSHSFFLIPKVYSKTNIELGVQLVSWHGCMISKGSTIYNVEIDTSAGIRGEYKSKDKISSLDSA